MQIHVNVIKEEDYTIDIDIPEEMEDELYEELSCQPCMDDVFDVISFLEEKGVSYRKYHDDNDDSRVEIWR